MPFIQNKFDFKELINDSLFHQVGIAPFFPGLPSLNLNILDGGGEWGEKIVGE